MTSQAGFTPVFSEARIRAMDIICRNSAITILALAKRPMLHCWFNIARFISCWSGLVRIVLLGSSAEWKCGTRASAGTVHTVGEGGRKRLVLWREGWEMLAKIAEINTASWEMILALTVCCRSLVDWLLVRDTSAMWSVIRYAAVTCTSDILWASRQRSSREPYG